MHPTALLSSRRNALALAITALAICVFAPRGHADVVTDGDTVLLFGTTTAASPQFDGPIAINTLGDPAYAIVPFEDPLGRYAGTVEVTVRRTSSTFLTSWYRVLSFSAIAPGYEIIGLTTESHFADALDVNYLLDEPAGVTPFSASFDGFGTPVTFNFITSIEVGDESSTLAVYNNMNDIATGLQMAGAHITVLDPAGGESTAPFMTFVSIIPAPPTMVLILVGASARRRRRA